jgi:hypothetical protein
MLKDKISKKYYTKRLKTKKITIKKIRIKIEIKNKYNDEF